MPGYTKDDLVEFDILFDAVQKHNEGPGKAAADARRRKVQETAARLEAAETVDRDSMRIPMIL